jgi:Flp pilus assembly protein TadD
VRTFHVEYVLEGYVQRVSSKVHINVLLISAKDETNVWTGSFDGDMADILKVQSDVAEKVGHELLSELPPPTAQPTPGQIDPVGYRAYLQGRKSWAARDLARSVNEYEQAVALMSNYAMSHSGLASAYALVGQAPNDGVPATVAAPKAIAEARRALALNANNAEAHYVLGNIAMSYSWDFPTAERELKEAIRLEPNNPTAHQWMGQYYMVTNRISEAQAETGKALDLDPVSPIFTIAKAEASYYAHEFDATIANSNLTMEQSPNFVLAEFWLGSAYREKRMYPESLQHFRNATTLVPNNPALMMAYGHALAVSGDANGARTVLGQLQTLSQHRNVPAIYFAGIYTGLGEKESAFRWLDKAVTEHNDRLIYLKVDPIADPLRSDPRFARLLSQIHMP